MIILNDKSEWSPDEATIASWKQAYPAVDIDAELKKMAAWCIANPQKRKTKSGIARFCNAWLAKAQNRGGSSPELKGMRGTPVDRDLCDVSWVADQQLRESVSRYFLRKYGMYWNGKEMVYA